MNHHKNDSAAPADPGPAHETAALSDDAVENVGGGYSWSEFLDDLSDAGRSPAP